MDYPKKSTYDFNDLTEIVKILRSPGGCPWDMAQTHQSIRSNFIEETYEAMCCCRWRFTPKWNARRAALI